MAQLAERTKLLCPVAGNASADGENPKPRLPQQRSREMLEVLKRIEAQLVSSG